MIQSIVYFGAYYVTSWIACDFFNHMLSKKKNHIKFYSSDRK